MKKYLLLTPCLFLAMIGCKDPQTDENVIRQRDSLISVIDERETSVNEFVTSFSDIERNLDEIAKKQHLILKNSDQGDLKGSKKDRINTEIQAINDMMEENTKKLKELNRKLNRSDKRNSELQKTIEFLNQQLSQKYVELAELNERLNSMNMQVTQLQTSLDTLSSMNMAQSQTINERTAELHTAYYIVGTSKELQEAKLIDKKGGVLGIGRTAKLSENLDNSMFTKIDYTQTTTIAINSENMKIVTTHPTDSYSLDKTDKMVNNLVITNPERFWSASKYLVITK